MATRSGPRNASSSEPLRQVVYRLGPTTLGQIERLAAKMARDTRSVPNATEVVRLAVARLHAAELPGLPDGD